MTTTTPVTPSRGATALDLLATLAPPPAVRDDTDIMTPAPRRAQWCDRCGTPRNLGSRECPGCRLLAAARGRLRAHLARHGMPAGGAVELARLADVPLRVVGEFMSAPAPTGARRPGGRRAPDHGISRTAR
ncbi:hypothetical protein [Miltoncostaea oceani]|uniref:hypothetical protein n=1 Tax=Miltoncostaea oceani TaxID=2843216 RepID=UPI001C3E76FE|nr:hypothetical protein [Miltoncostaea oceani]